MSGQGATFFISLESANNIVRELKMFVWMCLLVYHLLLLLSTIHTGKLLLRISKVSLHLYVHDLL